VRLARIRLPGPAPTQNRQRTLRPGDRDRGRFGLERRFERLANQVCHGRSGELCDALGKHCVEPF
jgi:hypothetical protein